MARETGALYPALVSGLDSQAHGRSVTGGTGVLGVEGRLARFWGPRYALDMDMACVDMMMGPCCGV